MHNQLNTRKQERLDLSELVWIIGYQLTAYIGRVTVETVAEWLQSGLPEELEGRMQAALDVALPIAEVESELIAQSFLIESLDGIEPYGFPALALRDAGDVQAIRIALMETAKVKFLANETSDLEDVERRLSNWIAQLEVPEKTKYKVLLRDDRLFLKLLHAGFPEEQQARWDKGEDWPLWAELIAEVPEMAISRARPDIESGSPFRYLRRAGSKPGRRFLNSPAKKKWLHQIKAQSTASGVGAEEPAPY